MYACVRIWCLGLRRRWKSAMLVWMCVCIFVCWCWFICIRKSQCPAMLMFLRCIGIHGEMSVKWILIQRRGRAIIIYINTICSYGIGGSIAIVYAARSEHVCRCSTLPGCCDSLLPVPVVFRNRAPSADQIWPIRTWSATGRCSRAGRPAAGEPRRTRDVRSPCRCMQIPARNTSASSVGRILRVCK